MTFEDMNAPILQIVSWVSFLIKPSQIVKWGGSRILQCDRDILMSSESESNSQVRVSKTYDHIKFP